MAMNGENNYYLKSIGKYMDDEEQSEIMTRIVELHPYASRYYTYDDIGTATLMADIFEDTIRHCYEDDEWYIWDDCRWKGLKKEDGLIRDKLETLLNMLLLYCDEVKAADETQDVTEYKKYIRSLRKNTAMKNVLAVLKNKVRISAEQLNSDPFVLNTPVCAYDLRTMSPVPDRKSKYLTQCTTTGISELTRCDRWYEFVDEIMSHDKEKAAFLQRALGYSLFGSSREECMFIAYGASTRNGKGTLFSSIQFAVGKEYMGGSDPSLICEAYNGRKIDFNSPQPALRKLVGVRIVNMSEAGKDSRLDSAAIKSMTGRDTLTTRGLFEGSFDFVPQFTMWLSTNHLPSVTDDTVFKSDRIWVIPFLETFSEDNRNKDLKDIFAAPENRPTILHWLIEGVLMYMKEGLNPPNCIKEATAKYRQKQDRLGEFVNTCCTADDDVSITRGELYMVYRNWCCKAENSFKPLTSTKFYSEMEYRGYHVTKRSDAYYFIGLSAETSKGGIKLS